MKNIIKFLSFSNIWIGLAACLLTLSNILSLHWLPNLQEEYIRFSNAKYLLVFNTFATIFIYTFIRIIGLREKHPTASSEMIDWVRKNKNLLIVWSVLCFAIAIYCLFHLYIVQIYIVLILGLVSVLYIIPIYKSANEWKSLRQIPYIKTVLVALVWAFLTVSCALVYADMYPVIIRPQHILLFIINFLFILGLTIPFDIRDLSYDKEGNLKTIAHLLGIANTKKLSIIILVLYIILSFLFYIYIPCDIDYKLFFRSYNLAIFMAVLLGGLGAIYIIKDLSDTTKEQVFTFELDGLIIAQSIFMIAIYSVYHFA